MLDNLLRGAFRLAHRRPGVVFLDLLWKAIWCGLTAIVLILVGAGFGSRIWSVAWLDTGNSTVNTAVAFALLRGFYEVHRTQIFGTVAAALFLSLVIWFVLEAAFRCKLLFPLPLGEGRVRVSGFGKSGDPHPALSQRERANHLFSTFLLSNVLKVL